MQRPDHALEVAPRRMSSERAIGFAFVGLLHVAIVAAIVMSLAPHVSTYINHITLLPEVVIPRAVPPPPATPTMQQPEKVFADRPIVSIDDGKPREGITVTAKPQPLFAEQTPITPAEGIAATHTQPPYPALAIRLAREGTVRLKLSIDTAGVVTSAAVESSSGSTDLDQAAIDWIKTHWRYHPAIARGAPVAWTSEAAVVFNLKRVQ